MRSCPAGAWFRIIPGIRGGDVLHFSPEGMNNIAGGFNHRYGFNTPHTTPSRRDGTGGLSFVCRPSGAEDLKKFPGSAGFHQEWPRLDERQKTPGDLQWQIADTLLQFRASF